MTGFNFSLFSISVEYMFEHRHLIFFYLQAPDKTCQSSSSQLRATKLDSRIAKFISLICNISMMKQQMLEIGKRSIHAHD